MKIAIIGGSGLENPSILADPKEIIIDTPYGKSSLKTGKMSGIDVVLLSRHGSDHSLPPTQVNNRANIHALKELGCTHIIATTACGSLREEIKRGDIIILDQFIDFTRHRKISFYEKFEPGNLAHTAMANPFSEKLRKVLTDTCSELGIKCHKKGTVITIEGPRFSTKAESRMFRVLGADVVNMSTAPEAILANEIGIPYAAIAMSTDYDCWKDDEEPVTWQAIMEVFKQNVEKVTELIINAIPRIEGFDIKSKIRTVPNWPKQGIMFRDITTLLKDSEYFSKIIELFVERYKSMKIDVVAGIESRGFITGSVLAHRLNLGFVPIRKAGKLPSETVGEEYDLEYGKNRIEIHRDAIKPGSKVLIVDDLVATGGTALAACNLIRKLHGEVVECCFIVNLPYLGGKKKLEQAGYKAFSITEFEGE
jgi:5'-methylthioadenosine phosphorylase